MAVSLIALTVTPSTAQAGYKPSVPQFTVKLIDNSYDVLPSTTTVTDPYTGKESVVTSQGYRVVDRTIEVTIKNQPFTPYKDTNSKEHKLRYRLQYKGHFEEDWGTFPLFKSEQYIISSDSEYTVVPSSSGLIYGINSLETGSKLDFRVEAVDGYMETLTSTYGMPIGEMFIADVSSGWSDVQTITVSGESSSSVPSQTTILPSTTPDSNGQQQYHKPTYPPDSIFTNPFFMLVIGVILGGVVVAAVVLVLRRQPKNSTQTNTYTELSQKLFSSLSTYVSEV
jgi:hypothetical protein